MHAQSPAAALTLCVVALLLLIYTPRLARWLVYNDDPLAAFREFFEPRWKREARYFASLIPDACAYCGNDPDPSVICPACYAQLQERRA